MATCTQNSFASPPNQKYKKPQYMLDVKNQLLPSNFNIRPWRKWVKSGKFWQIFQQYCNGELTPTPPLSIVIGCYHHKACHVYFHEWMFHYNREQHGWKTHQRCKRIRCDRLFPLVKKGRGACCIVVPLTKSRRCAASNPLLTCWCMSLFKGCSPDNVSKHPAHLLGSQNSLIF